MQAPETSQTAEYFVPLRASPEAEKNNDDDDDEEVNECNNDTNRPERYDLEQTQDNYYTVGREQFYVHKGVGLFSQSTVSILGNVPNTSTSPDDRIAPVWTLVVGL